MRNTGRSNNVSLDTIIKAPAFRQGVDHYSKGVEPIFDEPYKVAGRGRQNTMWSYERGRLFAAFARSKGLQLKTSEFFRERRLKWEIRELAREAYWAGVFN
jgi:hypothetical protein